MQNEELLCTGFVEGVWAPQRRYSEGVVKFDRLYSRSVKQKAYRPDEDGVTRIPVTKEYMAVVIGQNVPVVLPVEACFSDALYDSVSRLVYSLAKKYKRTCRDEEGDLVSECVLRIWKKLSTYNPKLSCFNTWCWRVCHSVLNSQYRKDSKHMGRLCQYDNEEIPEGLIGSVEPMEMEMGEANRTINSLFDAFPEMRHVLEATFGTREEGFSIPDRIRVTAIAKKTGEDYRKVQSFFVDKVRPMMRDRFGLPEDLDMPLEAGPVSSYGMVGRVICDLFRDFPDMRHVLVAIFGHPDSGLSVPEKVKVTTVADRTGEDCCRIQKFFLEEIEPALKGRFGREVARG